MQPRREDYFRVFPEISPAEALLRFARDGQPPQLKLCADIGALASRARSCSSTWSKPTRARLPPDENI